MKKASLALLTSLAVLSLLAMACSSVEESGRQGTAAALITSGGVSDGVPGDPDLRIAVVGAGPSGLTAALTLKDRGYRNITVFEKEGRVGGKVYSVPLAGASVELGAVFASEDYALVLDLAERFGIPHVPYAGERFILDEKGRRLGLGEFLLSRYTPAEIAEATRNYAIALENFKAIREDGFAGLPSDLHMDFDDFAKKHGFDPLAQAVKAIMVGFGYGYYENVPAQYYMKLMPWLLKPGPQGPESPAYFTFPGGFQSLWAAVASELDVRLSSTVTRIERGAAGSTAGPIRLTINGSRKQDFDAVIVSAPLHVVPKLMALTSEEADLFRQVETSRYFVTLFGAAGIQGSGTVFVYGNARPETINHLTVWGHPGGSLPLYIGYQHAAPGLPAPLVTAALAYDVHKLAGGFFLGTLLQKEWDYFPRVRSAALAAGFFEKVESLQGKGGVYYVGGTLSFETVEHSARYARAMVQDRFPVAAP